MHRTRSVVMASVILVLGTSSFAVARTGDSLIEGKRNGTTTAETSIVSDISGYSTRQSNKSGTGGGAIYGCRAAEGANVRPCIRANNLSTGEAFQFNSNTGKVVGRITVNSGAGDNAKPFTTNATGVADGLNADRVDGQNAAEIAAAGAAAGRTRWALVNTAGDIEAQSGGFKVLDAYQTNNNIYIDAGEDLTNNGITATIAIQNQNVPAGGNGFGGEISVSRCQITGVVECAPANSKNVNAFVVSPRNSDGTATGNGGTPNNNADDTPRKRFYVTITG